MYVQGKCNDRFSLNEFILFAFLQSDCKQQHVTKKTLIYCTATRQTASQSSQPAEEKQKTLTSHCRRQSVRPTISSTLSALHCRCHSLFRCTYLHNNLTQFVMMTTNLFLYSLHSHTFKSCRVAFLNTYVCICICKFFTSLLSFTL